MMSRIIQLVLLYFFVALATWPWATVEKIFQLSPLDGDHILFGDHIPNVRAHYSGDHNLNMAERTARTVAKRALTKELNITRRGIAEGEVDNLKGQIDKLKPLFTKFTDAHELYQSTLTEEKDLDDSDEYYQKEQDSYIDVLTRVNKICLDIDISVKKEFSLHDTSQSDHSFSKELVSVMNMPKVELEVFSGDPLNYHQFIRSFELNVTMVCSDGNMRLTRLMQYTSGPAKEAIRGCLLMGGDTGFKQAMSILSARFGNPFLVSEHILSNLRQEKPVRSAQDVQKLADDVRNAQIILSESKMLKEVDTQATIVSIVTRLQMYLQIRWKKRALEIKKVKGSYPDFNKLVDFLAEIAQEVNDPVYGQLAVKKPDDKRTFKSNSYSLSVQNGDATGAGAKGSNYAAAGSKGSNYARPEYDCILCGQKHRLWYCDFFKRMRPRDRLRLVTEHRLCENCLLPTHDASKCGKQSVCSVPGCGQKHTMWIHIHEQSSSTPRQDRVFNATTSVTRAHMPIVKILVNDSVEAFALLDSGSSTSFCSDRLARRLHLGGQTVTYDLNTLCGSAPVQSQIVSLSVTSSCGEVLDMSRVYVVDRIPVSTACVDTTVYTHLKDIDLVSGDEVDEVDLLIGQNYSEALVPLEVRKGDKGDPFAVRTILGWSLYGQSPVGKIRRSVISNFVVSSPIDSDVQCLWKLENDGLDSVSWSRDDKLVVDLWDRACEKLDGHFQIPIPWRDREVVSETKKFHTFVENRVSLIRELSDPTQWHHISGRENPADVLSRGVLFSELDLSLWFEGPEFLRQPRCDWTLSHSTPQLPVGDTEVRKEPIRVSNVVSIKSQITENPIDKVMYHFSDWYKMKKVLAWFIRLADICKGKKVKLGSLSVDQIKRAESVLVKHVQQQSFQEDIQRLLDGKQCSKGLGLLNPFLDQSNLLRVGGRLKNSDLEVKNPLIIPGRHAVAQSIIRHFHDRAHLGVEWTLSLVREHFWLTKARSSVKKVVRSCVVCRKLYAKPCTQIMADLPVERVEANKPPFTYVGIDVFGPFYVKVNRSEVKRYGCMFTCLVVRAVHIEKLASLETDSFINSLRRFIARRGVPQKVFSDNGTNFVGANAELGKALQQLSQKDIEAYALRQNIDWNFIPPSASHMGGGGAWERMIGCTRRIMCSLLSSPVRLSDEILETIFVEVESIINGRPLSKMSNDPNDFTPITPNHLLLMREGSLHPPGKFDSTDIYRKRWRCVQHVANQFWTKWLKLYLPELQKREKWTHVHENLCVGDLVLICEQNTPRNLWPLAIVKEVNVGRDDHVRSVRVKTRTTELTRPITKVILLEKTIQ